MSIDRPDRSKISTSQQERAALVYIRQSSLMQVRENLESQRRQYAFAEEARALGWSDARKHGDRSRRRFAYATNVIPADVELREGV